MRIEKRKISELIKAEYNPRKISVVQLQELKDGIEEFGLVSPLVVNEYPERKNIIVGGHQRLKIWEELGNKEVDCSIVNLPLDKERKLNIKLNKNGGTFDDDLLKEFFEYEELIEWGFTPSELFEDDIDTDPNQEEISIVIKRYSDKEIIEDAYEYYMKKGFPYPKLTLFEMKQELNKLANMNEESCKRSVLAYKVADTFHKHRFHSSAIGMRSPMQSFAIEKSLRKALKMDYIGNGIKQTTLGFINMVNGTQACANFRPAYARMMYEKYAGDDAVVFDSSTGYGGRLVGFLASGCKRYIGIDPNTVTHKANQRLFKTLKNGDKTCKLINLPAEDVNVEEYNIKEVADFSFTSPPYFKKEIYSQEETQSCNRYSEYEAWLNDFLKPMMKLNFDVIKPGGTTIINIEDVKIKGKVYPLVKPTIDAGKEVGFDYEKTERFELQHRTVLVNGKKESREAFESVIIFHKPKSGL